jgi:hypothetical protein
MPNISSNHLHHNSGFALNPSFFPTVLVWDVPGVDSMTNDLIHYFVSHCGSVFTCSSPSSSPLRCRTMISLIDLDNRLLATVA